WESLRPTSILQRTVNHARCSRGTKMIRHIPGSLLALLLPLSLLAADWPQFRGPDRTDVSKETGLLKAWPKDGPKLLWTFENAGIGFSRPAGGGDRAFNRGTPGG